MLRQRAHILAEDRRTIEGLGQQQHGEPSDIVVQLRGAVEDGSEPMVVLHLLHVKHQALRYR